MDPAQLHILQHSLGVDQHGQGNSYRNRFVTGPGGDDFTHCQELCRIGLMLDHGPQSIAASMHCFTVTSAGIDAVAIHSPAPTTIPKRKQNAKARYARFLEYGDGFENFRDFLGWDTSPERSWN